MTTRLHTLRSQLAGLRQARASARQLTAWTAVGTAVLWALIGVFLVDFILQREVAAPQRAILLLLAAAARHRDGARRCRRRSGRTPSCRPALTGVFLQSLPACRAAFRGSQLFTNRPPNAARWASRFFI